MSSDWATIRRKVQQGKDYRDTVVLSLDGEAVELEYELLSSAVTLELIEELDLEALQDHEDDPTDAEQRLRELQAKDELTDAEEDELEEVMREVQRNQAEVMDTIGAETFAALRRAGKHGLVPAKDDVEQAFAADPKEQRERFGTIPNTRDELRELLAEEMAEVLDGSPYPILFLVGQEVFAESMRALGNVDLAEVPEPT